MGRFNAFMDHGAGIFFLSRAGRLGILQLSNERGFGGRATSKRPDLSGPRQQKGCDRLVIRIKSRGNESIDQMLRRFKKLCEKEGLIKDVKRTSYYEKPSEKARRKDRKSLKRAQQESLEQQGRLKA